MRISFLSFMKHIVYLSRAVHSLSDQELTHLLTQSRRDNARNGVTGVLFYSHGHIAQLFEAEADVADRLFERIARDGRHSHVQKLVDKAITHRSFAEWSMAFHPLETDAFDTLQGFFLPTHVPPVPASLSIADATLVELVRLAVFGAVPTSSYLTAFREESDTPEA
jgi:hypothetical protein